MWTLVKITKVELGIAMAVIWLGIVTNSIIFWSLLILQEPINLLISNIHH